LFEKWALIRVVEAFFIFCLATSSVYFFNDLIDLSRDRVHPYKRKRPLASGALDLKLAVMVMLILTGTSFTLAAKLGQFFFISVLTYYLLNVAYSLYLKSLPIFDVFAIATGFVLRVYAGAFAINVHMDVWFLLTVVSASLFLAVGKRRSEMTILEATKMAGQHRQSLTHYTPELLGGYTTMFANTTWLSYALFSFLHPTFQAEGRVLELLSLLPRTLVVDKWLMATVPIVIFGVMRYMQVIYEKNEGESPHRILMTDRLLLSTVALWGFAVIAILYLI